MDFLLFHVVGFVIICLGCLRTSSIIFANFYFLLRTQHYRQIFGIISSGCWILHWFWNVNRYNAPCEFSLSETYTIVLLSARRLLSTDVLLVVFSMEIWPFSLNFSENKTWLEQLNRIGSMEGPLLACDRRHFLSCEKSYESHATIFNKWIKCIVGARLSESDITYQVRFSIRTGRNLQTEFWMKAYIHTLIRWIAMVIKKYSLFIVLTNK